MRAWVLAGAVALAAGSAGAQSFVSGNQFNQFCEKERISAEVYVMGSFDTSSIFSGLLDPDAQKPCIPNTANSAQARDIACNYVRDHPEDRHLPASVSVWNALREAFP